MFWKNSFLSQQLTAVSCGYGSDRAPAFGWGLFLDGAFMDRLGPFLPFHLWFWPWLWAVFLGLILGLGYVNPDKLRNSVLRRSFPRGSLSHRQLWHCPCPAPQAQCGHSCTCLLLWSGQKLRIRNEILQHDCWIIKVPEVTNPFYSPALMNAQRIFQKQYNMCIVSRQIKCR